MYIQLREIYCEFALKTVKYGTVTVESGLYYLEPQFGGQTRTFHRPHLSYLAIDFHYLHFDLQMKVNAGGCTHQLKLDVDLS